MQFKKKVCATLASLACATRALAVDRVPLPTSDSMFTNITALMQAFIDFAQGPLGIAAVFGAGVAGVLLWMFAPKENKLMGVLFRVIAGASIIFAGGAWIARLTGGAGGIGP
jgi:hypothetical protein